MMNIKVSWLALIYI